MSAGARVDIQGFAIVYNMEEIEDSRNYGTQIHPMTTIRTLANHQLHHQQLIRQHPVFDNVI